MHSNESAWSIQNLLSCQEYHIETASELYITQLLLFYILKEIRDCNEPLCTVLLLDWLHFFSCLKI